MLQGDKHASEPESEDAERRLAGDWRGARLRRRRVHVLGRVVRRQRDPHRSIGCHRATLRPDQRGRQKSGGNIAQDDQPHLGARLRRQQCHQVVHRAEARGTRTW